MIDLTQRILELLPESGYITSLALSDQLDVEHQKIVGAIKSIETKKDIIDVLPSSQESVTLTGEGYLVLKNGSYEALLFNALPPAPDGVEPIELQGVIDNFNIGFDKAMSLGWIRFDRSTSPPVIRRRVDDIVDITQKDLNLVLQNQFNPKDRPEKFKEYKKRKLIQMSTIKYYKVARGPNFTTVIAKLETDLTSDMLLSGDWKTLSFKKYNFDALGTPLECGYLHPLMKVRSEFRQIFLEMGFAEMPTNNYVENSFWNFDALFQPQQHPARDAHDTFFIADPAVSSSFPMEYLDRVKTVHSVGGHGSLGYRYNWKLEEAQKNVLRTHTTAVSARMLYELAQRKKFEPVKWFSIDKVFRNETLDATHLAEFHQVEGVIADYDVTLGDLIGVFTEFFNKLGMTQLEFKPAYNPYTEPSMEIFCFHVGLDKWIEVGNSGVFRPEMLLPMGLPESVSVIAWGLSLERPTMIRYGFNNIRDLVGPKVDLQMVQNSPICRLNK